MIFVILSTLGCSLSGKSIFDDEASLQTCTEGEVPAQLRLLTRNEYNSSIYQAFYSDGTSCSSQEECSSSESCLYGVCRPQPCDIHTFTWPYEGEDVRIAGTFNDWKPQPMSKRDGVWTQTLRLDAGEWVYKFVVDGNWYYDVAGEDLIDDGYGGYNNRFVLSCSDLESVLADPSSKLPIESTPQHFGFDNHSSSLVHSNHIQQYLAVAEVLAPEIVSSSDFDLVDFGRLVFRRPLTADEITRYSEMEPEIAVSVMLSSVHFLYRDETEHLIQYRLASALAYFLWGNPPDNWLLSKAEDGSLDDITTMLSVVDEMLQDPRAEVQMQNFAVQWLEVKGILTADKGIHDTFDGVRTSIYHDAGKFVSEAFFSHGTLSSLLTTTVEPIDDMFESIDAGVLGLPAVLASTAHSDQTSPVQRGLFVREQLLCQHLGTPPANAGGVPDVDPDSSTRERFEQHSNDPACAACHTYIDPIGFGFEHFNEIGVWRDMDGEHPINAQGYIDGVDNMGDSSGGAFSSLPELAAYIAQSDRFYDCVSDNLLRFSTGNEVDECVAHDVSSNDVPTLLRNIVRSDVFLKRER